MRQQLLGLLLKVCLIIFSLFMVACSQAVIIKSSLLEQQRALDLINQGVFALRRGQLDEAEAAFKVAYELSPQAAALDGQACVAIARHNNQQAIVLLKAALDLEPTYVQAFANLAYIQAELGNTAVARSLYAKAIEIQPDIFTSRNNYALLLSEAGEISEAKIQLIAASLLSNDPVIKINLELLQDK